MGEIGDAFARLHRAPGGFADAHDGDARRLHHRDVRVEPLVGRIFVIIGDAEQRAIEVIDERAGPCLRRPDGRERRRHHRRERADRSSHRVILPNPRTRATLPQAGSAIKRA